MAQIYGIRNYTAAQWDTICEDMIENDGISFPEDTIEIVWGNGAARLDITANGKRVVPIMRKIEKTLQAAGLSGDGHVFDGWFGPWADSLTDRTDRKYFLWHYYGDEDRRRGCWSYSWGIEQINDDQWYLYLNIAI